MFNQVLRQLLLRCLLLLCPLCARGHCSVEPNVTCMVMWPQSEDRLPSVGRVDHILRVCPGLR